MPRNISFALTTDQFRDRTKTVTRRKGWKFLKSGDILNGCVKCMGLKPWEKFERLGQIRVRSIRYESMALMDDETYGRLEATREGFPELTGEEFVDMFCAHMGGKRDQVVTRIEFEYLDPHWIAGEAEQNGRPVNVCSKCGWAIADFAEDSHKKTCWGITS